MKTVVVGMSGGVDSSVSALILKKIGFNVIGVFMQNWDNVVNNELNYSSETNTCDAFNDFEFASKICKKLDIPIYKVDFISEYWDKVFLKFIDDYKKGITPNPDVLCNKYIKFDEFAKYCFKNFKCDYIATGHYAKIIKKNNIFYLSEAKDTWKDQTYFLCELSQKQISKVIFPLMFLNKNQVREIAKKYNLINWDRKDSTGICFIGKRNFRSFLSNYIDEKKGNIVDINSNKIIGSHNGAWFYTIGQRKGLKLSGNDSRYFVCKKNIEENTIYVSNSNSDDYLLSNTCIVKKFNWISGIPKSNVVQMRFRHCQVKIDGYFEINETGDVQLFYSNETKSVTEGQYAVLYQDNICLGGGQISLTKLI